MKKVLALTLTCVVCMGCQSGGQRQPAATTISSTPPAATAPPHSPLASDSGANQAAATGGMATVTNTIGRIWKAVAFQQPAAEPAPVSPEMTRFNSFVGAVSAQTSQLNINDPPQVTRQKAEGILTTLNDWDSVLAAGRSIGLVNDTTAELMTSTVAHLTAETKKLLQYAPSPETIGAVKQLGGRLGAAYSGVQGILAQGSSVSRALLGGNPQ